MTRKSSKSEAEASAPHRPGTGFLIALVVACLVSAGIGTLAMKALQPAVPQVSAQPILVTFPIQRGVLSQTIVARARVSYAAMTTISEHDSDITVATDVAVTRGDTVSEGARLIDINERPIVAFQGEIPMYRDLCLGDEGKDVTQLNGALVRLGFLTEESDTFTEQTATALTSFYKQLGYSAPKPPSDAVSAVTQAEAAVQQAQKDLDTANASISRAGVLSAQLAVAQAQTALDADPTSNEAKLALQLAKQQLSDAQSPPDVARAKTSLSKAQTVLAQAQAHAQPQALLSEIAFVPALPATVVSEPPSSGAVVDGKLFDIASGSISAQVSLSLAQHTLVQAGQSVTVQSDDGLLTASGQIDSVGTVLETTFDGTQAFIARMSLVDADPALAGQEVKATITVQQSEGEVLQVPQAAIESDMDGRTYVDMVSQEDGDGTNQRVYVTVGIVAEGMVEITSDDLHEGDRVIVDHVGS